MSYQTQLQNIHFNSNITFDYKVTFWEKWNIKWNITKLCDYGRLVKIG